MATRLVTGLTPEREQAWQERQMLRIARASEKAIRREVARAYRAFYRGDDDALQTHSDRMERILKRIYNACFDTFGNRLWSAIQKSHKPSETKRDTVPLTPQFDLARRLWITTSAAYKVTEIAGTTQEQAIAIIQKATEEAVAEGLSEIDTAALIRSRINEAGGDLSRLRSRMIARTESHSASAASTQMAAKASGLPMQKEWIASGGERTRTAHASAHGQKVNMDEPFNVGGELLMVPGDVNGSAANVINCRCVCGYSLE
jgi:uncharacterized protein with gpF-like domain